MHITTHPVELVMYIEEAPRQMVFQLSDLAKMYSCSLEKLGGHVAGCVNSTRLKDHLLAQIHIHILKEKK